jgi:DNA adenine methylase
MTSITKPPFPYFGSKRAVAPIIWKAFGKVSNYIEPFAGSLAVLLNNPEPAKIETVNDINHFLSNFWRSVAYDPSGVAKYADYPVTEIDLHARHRWLVSAATDDFKTKLMADPNYYDIEIAGWWVWGIGASVPGNWMQNKGINAKPLLSSGGGGIHGLTYSVTEQFQNLQSRLKRVRVSCGDWSRVLTPAITFGNKGVGPKDITGVFLDPPYSLTNRDKRAYQDEKPIYSEVCQWAIDNGDNERMRVVVCGYKDDHEFPSSWKQHEWKTNGGMANQALGDSSGKDNSKREVIYFSPACLDARH